MYCIDGDLQRNLNLFSCTIYSKRMLFHENSFGSWSVRLSSAELPFHTTCTFVYNAVIGSSVNKNFKIPENRQAYCKRE